MKRQLEEVKGQSKKENSAVDPLRREVEKLTRENNDLHIEMIRMKEKIDLSEIKWETSLKSLEDQKRDLKFIVDQKDIRVGQLSKENESLRVRIEELLSKLYLPSKAADMETAPREYMNEVLSRPHNKIGNIYLTKLWKTHTVLEDQ